LLLLYLPVNLFSRHIQLYQEEPFGNQDKLLNIFPAALARTVSCGVVSWIRSSNLCVYQFFKQTNFVFTPFSVYSPLQPVCNVECNECFVMNFIILIISKFGTKLLVANHLIMWQRTKFDTEQKSSKFLLEIMTLVSSANNIDFDTGFILRGRSFICIMNNRVPRIDPWGIHVSVYPT